MNFCPVLCEFLSMWYLTNNSRISKVFEKKQLHFKKSHKTGQKFTKNLQCTLCVVIPEKAVKNSIKGQKESTRRCVKKIKYICLISWTDWMLYFYSTEVTHTSSVERFSKKFWPRSRDIAHLFRWNALISKM